MQIVNIGAATDLPKLLAELEKYGAGDPDVDDIQALEIELYYSPDRGAAVVLGDMAEKAIVKLLSRIMKEEDIKGNFGTKIDVAYARALFGAQTKRELTIIRHLRNQFAHSRKPIEFTAPIVKKCCVQLFYPDAPGVVPIAYVNNAPDRRLKDAIDKSHPRTKYSLSVHEIISRVYVVRGHESDPINHLT
jgi:hypothetical protein